MNTRSIKFRLIAWFAGWLGALFITFGLVVYHSLDYYLRETAREALERRTRQLARLVQASQSDPEGLRKEIQMRFAPEANNRFTRVRINGRVEYTSEMPADNSFDPKAVPPPVATKTASFQRKQLPNGGTLFIAVLPIKDSAGQVQGLIEEGISDREIRATLHAWAVALVAGLVLLVMLAVFGGYIIAQRALQPVDKIIAAAQRISSRNLSERLPVPHSGDELERLSLALNNMIRRLDESFRYNQRFLADASHELRTPLTILQAELEAMLDKLPRHNGERELAGSALEEVERLRTIVEGLFALSRLDAGEAMNKSETFDLRELVASTTEQMSLLAEDKRIVITCEAAGRLLVRGDRARLKQVAVNLLDNAIKYTPEGGRIIVRVGASGERAVLEVTDTGIGIPAEALPHVFERFYRVDKARSRQQGGAGLGLSIVNSICTAHQGRVEVHSREGEGTRFVVQLPLGSNEPQSI